MNTLQRTLARLTLKVFVHLDAQSPKQPIRPAFQLWQVNNKAVRLAGASYLVRNLCSMPEKKPFERLPGNVVPQNYALRLKPDLKAFTFEGFEEIAVEVECSS